MIDFIVRSFVEILEFLVSEEIKDTLTVDEWHLDEVVMPISGRKYWFWRAVDANGNVLDILVQHQSNAKAALPFLKRLIARFGEPQFI